MSTLHGSKSRERILHTFAQALVELGYDALTVAELLRRSGVGRATFYEHFRNKEELFGHSVLRLQAALQRAGEQVDEPLGFLRPFFRHVGAHHRLYLHFAGRPSFAVLEHHMRRMLAELVRRDAHWRASQAAADGGEVAVQFIVGALWTVLSTWIERRTGETADAMHARFTQLAGQGLFPPAVPAT